MSQFGSSEANSKWLPKLFLCLQQYSRQDLVADGVAGLTVGLVALPLAMAFGIASGVTPQAGLYTAVVAGFLISALGGSRVQIGGPTGAFVVIVAGIIVNFGLSGLFMVTLMAGVMLIAMGITGFGAAVKFIPRPVTTTLRLATVFPYRLFQVGCCHRNNAATACRAENIAARHTCQP